MTTTHYADAVRAHYTGGDLSARFFAGLRAAGIDPETLQVNDLAQYDQFHAGGADATRALIQQARLAPGMQVLDVGGGLGGAARLIAHDAGCTVTVLDLSAESCQVGALLTAQVGLAGQVTFRQGSGLEMPFPDGAFERVWLQHVSMNIAEKALLFSEIRRVLRPGGLLALQEIVGGAVEPVLYPVPWAADASISFLLPPAEMRALLAGAGFLDVEWHESAGPAGGGPQGHGPVAAPNQPSAPPLALLVIGPQLPQMQANVQRNLREGRLVLVQAVLERL